MDSITKPQLPWYRRLNQMKGLLLALVSMAQMLDIINVASVTITLPDIMKDVGYKVDQLQWVTSAYALAYGAFLLIGGRLGDLFGHRRIYIIGVTWFSIWAVINGFSKDPIIMSVGRALQGMGAGFTIPSALAILTTTYPVGPERTQALAVFGGTGAIGSVIGVLFGGIFGSTIGWRWIFYITAILGFMMAVLGFIVIPSSQDISRVEDRRIDLFGITSFTAGIWKIDYPIMPLRIWRSRRLVASCLTIICVSAAINTMIFFSSLTFQNVQGYSPMKTSLTYIVHGIGAIATIIALTKLVTMVRTKILMVVGWLFFIASGVLFAQIKADSSYWSIAFPALILNFLGMAPVWLCCQINSVADANDEDQGVTGAVYNVSLQIGAPIGIAISNIIANGRNPHDAFGPALLPGYQSAFYSYAIMAGVGLVVTLIFATNRDPIKMSQPDAKETIEDEEQGSDAIGHPAANDTARNSEIFEVKGGVESAAATTIFQGSATSLGQAGEKTELKE
ncbi:hypothetical protein BG000_007631 [Podila horticola]|nr:hypothetical protein BG000_007631 [Podila horticola]